MLSMDKNSYFIFEKRCFTNAEKSVVYSLTIFGIDIRLMDFNE